MFTKVLVCVSKEQYDSKWPTLGPGGPGWPMAPFSPFSPLSSCHKNNLRSLQTDQTRFYCLYLKKSSICSIHWIYRIPMYFLLTWHSIIFHILNFTLMNPLKSYTNFLSKVSFFFKSNYIESAFYKHNHIISNVFTFIFNILKRFLIAIYYFLSKCYNKNLIY